jgi:hypothetical protein
MVIVKRRWSMVLAFAMVAGLAGLRTDAGEVRDRAGMFSPEAVKDAKAKLDRIEQKTGIPIVVETIDRIPGLDRNASTSTRRAAIERLAEQRAKEIGYEGAYLLISKGDRVSSPLLVRERYEPFLPKESRQAVIDALLGGFKAGNFDKGLISATEALDRSLASAAVVKHRGGAPALAGPERVVARPGKSGLGTLLMIGLGIFGVLLVLRILGGLFNRGASGYPAQMGMGEPRPGMGAGPGYGPPGYGYGGGRGGGFFSGMLGGLGGALAGNWLYDQFSGRHGSAGHTETSSYTPGEANSPANTEGDSFVGGDDYGGQGVSWDNPSGGDTGGDWGGGDGGADWGGGGDGGDW